MGPPVRGLVHDKRKNTNCRLPVWIWVITVFVCKKFPPSKFALKFPEINQNFNDVEFELSDTEIEPSVEHLFQSLSEDKAWVIYIWISKKYLKYFPLSLPLSALRNLWTAPTDRLEKFQIKSLKEKMTARFRLRRKKDTQTKTNKKKELKKEKREENEKNVSQNWITLLSKAIPRMCFLVSNTRLLFVSSNQFSWGKSYKTF